MRRVTAFALNGKASCSGGNFMFQSQSLKTSWFRHGAVTYIHVKPGAIAMLVDIFLNKMSAVAQLNFCDPQI